jgi:hypothetical protein
MEEKNSTREGSSKDREVAVPGSPKARAVKKKAPFLFDINNVVYETQIHNINLDLSYNFLAYICYAFRIYFFLY